MLTNQKLEEKKGRVIVGIYISNEFMPIWKEG
jgi:hypothetical protein